MNTVLIIIGILIVLAAVAYLVAIICIRPAAHREVGLFYGRE